MAKKDTTSQNTRKTLIIDNKHIREIEIINKRTGKQDIIEIDIMDYQRFSNLFDFEQKNKTLAKQMQSKSKLAIKKQDGIADFLTDNNANMLKIISGARNILDESIGYENRVKIMDDNMNPYHIINIITSLRILWMELIAENTETTDFKSEKVQEYLDE